MSTTFYKRDPGIFENGYFSITLVYIDAITEVSQGIKDSFFSVGLSG